MTRRKEERYKRAMARLAAKPDKEEAIIARVDAALLSASNKKLPVSFRENYIDHKLGRRRGTK